MEPVQGSTSGHMQLDMLKSQTQVDWHGLVHALVMEDLLLILWALTTTVSQDLIVFHGFLWSTLMTRCGMDKVVMDLSVHAVILQTSLGSARKLPQSTTDDLEVRICGDGASEDTPIDLVQLYIQ